MTECKSESMRFLPHAKWRVEGDFDGGLISSHGGGILLRELEDRFQIIDQFSRCFVDHRNPALIEHSVKELVAQRVLAMALGYEDLNDHDRLRTDPLLALLVGKVDITGETRANPVNRGCPLAGKSTLNRLELSANALDGRYKKIAALPERIQRLLTQLYIQKTTQAPTHIVLDLDATDDPLHGNQEGRFFHGYYDEYCYLPLYIFAGDHLLCANLREASVDGASGSIEALEMIVPMLREAWPQVGIRIRADSGFCRDEIMCWCEDNDVEYVLGLARNPRLTAILQPALDEALAASQASRQAERIFREFDYQTIDSWHQPRRVIGKAEALGDKANPRYIVTNLPAGDHPAQSLYEVGYCGRGNMENHIKEQQLWLFADRTSSYSFRANQLRMWFSALAYILLQTLRDIFLAGTELANATSQTIRLRLLRLGVRLKISARRLYLSFTSACPDAALFRFVLGRLQSC